MKIERLTSSHLLLYLLGKRTVEILIKIKKWREEGEEGAEDGVLYLHKPTLVMMGNKMGNTDLYDACMIEFYLNLFE